MISIGAIHVGGSRPLARIDYRFEVDPLMRHLGGSFVGREAELARLAAFAGAPDGGYLLVEAGGGFGKSALIAQLVLAHERGQWPGPRPALVFFFVRDPGWRSAGEFLPAVNAQLLALLGHGGGTPGTLEELRTQLSELWAEAVRRAGASAPLLLLVDGLDEMAPGPLTIADLLPGTLGPHVHVVVTSRPNPDARRAASRYHPLRRAKVLALDRLDARGCAAMLRAAAPGRDDPALAARIAALTRGEPLYVRFVCEDVGQRGEAALADLERSPPADVREYFSEQLVGIRQAAAVGTPWNVCGLLACARGPIAVTAIAGALGVPLRVAEEAVDRIRRFLVGDGEIQFFHQHLLAVLRERFRAEELAQYRAQLAAWCAQAAFDDRASVPDYALRHSAEHFAEAQRKQDLFRLVGPRWMRAHFARFHGLTGFIADVERAREAAAASAPPDVYQELRTALARCSVGTAAREVPTAAVEALARYGRRDEATGYAALIMEPGWRTLAFVALARGLAASGRRREAQEAHAEALASLGEDAANAWCGSLLRELVGSLAACGDAEDARRLLHSAVRRSMRVVDVVPFLARLGRAARGLAAGDVARDCLHAAVQHFEDVASRAARVASGDAPAGDDGTWGARTSLLTILSTDGAAVLELAHALGDDDSFARMEQVVGACEEREGAYAVAATAALAVAGVAAGRPRAAMDARLITAIGRCRQEAPPPTATLVDASRTLAGTVFGAEGRRLVEIALRAARARDRAIRQSGGRPGLDLAEAIGAAAEAGLREPLIELLDEIERDGSAPADHDSDLAALAKAFAQSGDIDRALRAVASMREEGYDSYRGSARAGIASALIRRGDSRGAFAVVDAISDVGKRAWTLGVCARAALDRDDGPTAVQAADMAVAAAMSSGNVRWCAELFGEAALALLDIGRQDAGRQLAHRAGATISSMHPNERGSHHVDLACLALIRAGKPDAAETLMLEQVGAARFARLPDLCACYRGAIDRARAAIDRIVAGAGAMSADERAHGDAFLGQTYALLGLHDEARAALLRAETLLAAGDADARRDLGIWAQVFQGWYDLGAEDEAKRCGAIVRDELGRRDTMADEFAPGCHVLVTLGAADEVRSRLCDRLAATPSVILWSDVVALLARAFEPAQALILLRELREREMRRPPDVERPSFLAAVALAAHTLGDRALGLAAARQAFAHARSNDRIDLLGAMATCAPCLAAIDGGDTLIRACDAVDELAGWWSRAPPGLQDHVRGVEQAW